MTGWDAARCRADPEGAAAAIASLKNEIDNYRAAVAIAGSMGGETDPGWRWLTEFAAGSLTRRRQIAAYRDLSIEQAFDATWGAAVDIAPEADWPATSAKLDW